MVRRPWAVLFVLCHAVSVLRWRPLGAFIQYPGLCATDVEEDQPDGPADGGVGAIARTEGAVT